MKWKITDLRTCLNFISAVILLAGLGSAILIYHAARSDSGAVLGYEDAGGSVYPIMPEDSKQYLGGLALYGGTANVLADEFRRWFAGLWHGKSLAFTVGCIAIFISSGVFYAANRPASRQKSDAGSKNDSGRRS
jgi:hypothetical protein